MRLRGRKGERGRDGGKEREKEREGGTEREKSRVAWKRDGVKETSR